METESVKAVVVFATMAMGRGLRDTSILATCASPVTLGALAAQGIGESRVASVKQERGKLVAMVEQVYAGQVLAKREETPTGALARDAVKTLFLRGSIFKGVAVQSASNLEAAHLLQRILRAKLGDPELDCGPWTDVDVPDLDTWVGVTIQTLGLESGTDLELLSPNDLLSPALPDDTLAWLDKQFPRQVNVGDAQYRVEYDLLKREVTLVKESGNRKGPPSMDTVPLFRGFKIKVKHVSKVWVLREAL